MKTVRLPKGRIASMTTRPPMERMMRAFGLIKQGDYPSRERLSVDLEVTVKTVQRDVDFMRERMGIPISYCRINKGYFFTGDVSDFPMLEITEAELISVFVAQKMLSQFRGTPFEAPLQSAFDKLKSGTKEKISISWADIDTALSFKSIEARPAEVNVFQLCSKGTNRHLEIEFEYKKLNSAKYERRLVLPYHLACVLGQWYLFAYDVKRKEMRTFVLARMKGVELTQKNFTRPVDFNIQKHLKDSFGVFRGKGNHDVRIHFDAFAAQLIRERIWHPSQQIQELSGGELELQLSLSSFEEIIPWVLSWGDHAEVVSPKSLSIRLGKILQSAARFYP